MTLPSSFWFVKENRRLRFVVDLGVCMFGKDEIHELILSFAEVGANVVRLKGGDPLVSCCCFFGFNVDNKEAKLCVLC